MEENQKKKEGMFDRYPYKQIESRESFKNRPLLRMGKDAENPEEDDKRIFMELDMAHYERVPAFDMNDPVAAQEAMDFCLHRMWDYANALDQAENQISDILHDYPFLPEDFGFKRKPDSNGIYYKVTGDKEKESRKFQLNRQRDSATGTGWCITEDGAWDPDTHIMIEITSFKQAYTVLKALGIYDDAQDDQAELKISISDEEVSAELKKQEEIKAREKEKADFVKQTMSEDQK